MIDRDRVRELIGEPTLSDEQVDEVLALSRQLVGLFLDDVFGQSGETPFYDDAVVDLDHYP